jgi:DNA polymerase III epsilon subunit-like protein
MRSLVGGIHAKRTVFEIAFLTPQPWRLDARWADAKARVETVSGKKRLSLRKACEPYGIKSPGRHNAVQDAAATLKLWEALDGEGQLELLKAG